MSAFVVSMEHINAILQRYEPTPELSFEQAGQLLIDWNFKSVNYRYGENAEPYRFYKIPIKKLSDVQIYKAINCYEYQSCEHTDYFSSEASALIKNIVSTLSDEFSPSEYEEAEWSIEGKKWHADETLVSKTENAMCAIDAVYSMLINHLDSAGKDKSLIEMISNELTTAWDILDDLRDKFDSPPGEKGE